MAQRKTAKREDNEGSDTSAPARPLVVEGGKGLVATRIGKSFIDAPPAEMHAFIERLFGG